MLTDEETHYAKRSIRVLERLGVACTLTEQGEGWYHAMWHDPDAPGGRCFEALARDADEAVMRAAIATMDAILPAFLIEQSGGDERVRAAVDRLFGSKYGEG